MNTFLELHKDEKDKTIYAFSNLDQLYAFFPDMGEKKVNTERLRTGFSSKFIYTTERGPILKANDAASNRISRYVPLDKYPLRGDFTIVGHHVLMLSLTASRPIAVSLDSQEIADGLRALFNLAWDMSETYDTEA